MVALSSKSARIAVGEVDIPHPVWSWLGCGKLISASFTFVKCLKYKGFIGGITTPPVPGRPVKLNLKITLMMSQALEQPVVQYNQWPHRFRNALLTDSQFEMELSDFPVFWQQFLIALPSLKKMLKPLCLDALRKFPEEKAGPTFQRVLEMLE